MCVPTIIVCVSRKDSRRHLEMTHDVFNTNTTGQRLFFWFRRIFPRAIVLRDDDSNRDDDRNEDENRDDDDDNEHRLAARTASANKKRCYNRREWAWPSALPASRALDRRTLSVAAAAALTSEERFLLPENTEIILNDRWNFVVQSRALEFDQSVWNCRDHTQLNVALQLDMLAMRVVVQRT